MLFLNNAYHRLVRKCFFFRFIGTGNTFRSLAYEFRIGRSTISKIVRETCDVLWQCLKEKVMKLPNDEEWEKISNEFQTRANFPNCIGALDGKHIRITNPKSSGSQFFNYKQYFSIVFLALVDSNYCFRAVDVGHYGKCGDSNIFRQSALNNLLVSGQLNLPNNKALPNFEDITPMPYVIVADEAFSMTQHVMRPYPRRNLNEKKRIFNYRLSRARRFVECAFGILANKWRVFHSAICLDPDFVQLIVLAACVLHNFVRVRDGYTFEDTLSNPFQDIEVIGTGGTPSNAKSVREKFADYFTSPTGSVPWQFSMI